jgi:hypothetical protein
MGYLISGELIPYLRKKGTQLRISSLRQESEVYRSVIKTAV